MKKKKKTTILKCPKCGCSLWYRPDGSILCEVCMYLMDKEGNPWIDKTSTKSVN